MGSFAIISIALNGAGCSSMIVCSKRGFEPGRGRGAWFVDQVRGKLGACHVVGVDSAWPVATLVGAAAFCALEDAERVAALVERVIW